MRVEFEWGISDPDSRGMFYVRERLAGTEFENYYGPLPNEAIAKAVVTARRQFVHKITTKAGAMQVFEPRPNLEALRLFQNKGHLDS